jgi:hypothetical protein
MKTLRKSVDEWVIFWEKSHDKAEQKESLPMFIANKTLEWYKNQDKPLDKIS